MENRKLWLLFSAALISIIIYLTFQNRNSTESLSNSIKSWFNSIGINVSGKQLRSNAHIVEYCLLGVALSKYALASNNKIRWVIYVGFCLGLIDEMARVFIPTREFELIDLVKDWIGIVFGVIIVYLFHNKPNND